MLLQNFKEKDERLRKEKEKPLMINYGLYSGRESRRCRFIYFSGIEHIVTDIFVWVKD